MKHNTPGGGHQQCICMCACLVGCRPHGARCCCCCPALQHLPSPPQPPLSPPTNPAGAFTQLVSVLRSDGRGDEASTLLARATDLASARGGAINTGWWGPSATGEGGGGHVLRVCVWMGRGVSGLGVEETVLTAASQPACLPACLVVCIFTACSLPLSIRTSACHPPLPVPLPWCLPPSCPPPTHTAPKKRGRPRKSAAASGGLSEGDVSDWGGGGGAAARQQQQQAGGGASKEDMRALKDSLRLMAAEVAVSQVGLTVDWFDFTTCQQFDCLTV